jgi:hypothetical protein
VEGRKLEKEGNEGEGSDNEEIEGEEEERKGAKKGPSKEDESDEEIERMKVIQRGVLRVCISLLNHKTTNTRVP